MSRIRTIKPEAFESLTLARVPIPARWVFAGFWTAADDEGRFADSIPLLRSKVFPVEDVTLGQVGEWIDALLGAEHLCRYEVAGVSYLHVPKWHEHQVINRPSPSRLPPCPRHATGKPQEPRRRGPRPRLVKEAPGPAEPEPEPSRRCPEHVNDKTAPKCGACKEARIDHERWERSRREAAKEAEAMAKTALCGSAACTCNHEKCDYGFFAKEHRLPNGAPVEVQVKCPDCFPVPASSTKSERGVHKSPTFIDARDLGAEYADHAAAAAGDR